MCDEIYTSMFTFLDQARQLAFAGRKCYGVAEVRQDSQSTNYEVIVTQNGVSGLMNGGARTQLGAGANVTFFSVTSRASRGNYIRILPSDQITRTPNRHAEMNVVMYCIARYLEQNPGGSVADFSLDTYCRAINPSLNFCPECQFALALLSKPAAKMIGGISQLVRDPNNVVPPVLFLRGTGKLSNKWSPPWTTYFQDLPDSDFFETLRQNQTLGGEYSVGYNSANGNVVIYAKQADGTWAVVHQARGRA